MCICGQHSLDGRRQRGNQVSPVHDADGGSHHGLEGLFEHLIAHPAPATQAHQFCVAKSAQQLEAKPVHALDLYLIKTWWAAASHRGFRLSKQHPACVQPSVELKSAAAGGTRWRALIAVH